MMAKARCGHHGDSGQRSHSNDGGIITCQSLDYEYQPGPGASGFGAGFQLSRRQRLACGGADAGPYDGVV